MKYTLKIWGITNLISATFFLISYIIKPYELFSFIVVYVIFLGLILSIPAMIIFWFLQKKLFEKYTVIKSKVILSIYSFVSVWVTLFLLNILMYSIPIKNFVSTFYRMAFLYIIPMIFAIWLFKNSKALKLNLE
ncbi:hypothetical protein [Chryseobacterium oryzae]|uniref:Uncharacterized protein n=1 Tax=Chryseobacterium oryzae TaxID=2929799 RepID=A0ABY4BGF9_9FLAO|nr:hypothetical protein [Chryseobacterium oryzae]UOE38258.1 hypothetical protein MTP08_00330 [Chryseobacterium oryzae]